MIFSSVDLFNSARWLRTAEENKKYTRKTRRNQGSIKNCLGFSFITFAAKKNQVSTEVNQIIFDKLSIKYSGIEAKCKNKNPKKQILKNNFVSGG